MRLLLVMPTGLQVGYDNFFSSSPLGIETLAAHARRYADVSLADVRGGSNDFEAHADKMLADSPEIVGISLNAAPHTNYTLKLAEALRRRRGDLKIIVGGQQATFLPRELLGTGNIDAIVRGEGEETLTEILQRGGDWRGVAGVSWRDNGAFHDEPDRPLRSDLDSLELPARDLLPDRSRYRMGAVRVEGIESSRGCPFQCSFCSIRNFHRGKWRAKSVQRVMREVDFILERYPERKVIYFADDNFATDIRRVEGICQAIIQRRTEAFFWCQARADMLAEHPEIVELMGKAHFAAVLVGIETPVERLLASAKKGTKPGQVEKAIKLLHAQDVGIWGTFCLGLPGETPEETRLAGEYIAKTKVDVAQITVATPIPGSALYDEAKAAGDIFETDWDRFDFTSPTMKGQMSKKDLDAIIQKAYLGTYLSGRFLLSLFSRRTNLHRLRQTAFSVFWTWIKFMIKVRLAALVGYRGKILQPHERQALEEAKDK
jgi:anaerobic magnesium-protoporphyrin IX monomethyl ester cyclase